MKTGINDDMIHLHVIANWKAHLPLQALRIEARPAASSILLGPGKDVQTRPRPRPFGASFGERIGGEGGQGEYLEELADGGRHGEPAGARIGAGDGGHVRMRVCGFLSVVVGFLEFEPGRGCEFALVMLLLLVLCVYSHQFGSNFIRSCETE